MKCIWALGFSFFVTIAIAQNNSAIKLFDLRNEKVISYKDSLGKFVGCDLNLECRRIGVTFYEVEIDKLARNIVIKGKVYDSRWSTNSDTSGVAATAFYLGKPKIKNGDILQNLRYLNSSDSSGYFKIDLRVLPGDRLYIADPMFLLEEYRVNDLLFDY